MTVATLGYLTLGLGIFSAGAQMWGASFFASPVTQRRWASLVAFFQFFFAFSTFLTLLYAFIASDFSLVTVALNSHRATPLIYKIGALWANHEGSLLLWTCLSTALTFGFAYTSIGLPPPFYVKTLQYLGGFNFCFFMFIVLTSNPFFTVGLAPYNGQGLNPLLQDPSMLIHPPLLYGGYIAFMVPLALALAFFHFPQLPNFATIIRPWVLGAWAALTLGITLGSFWAYYELGWGGWWFWDPVENASLMPWCLGTALVHAVILLKYRKIKTATVLFLVYATFLFCVLGAFLTRSGILSSVHTFAYAPERGRFILFFVLGLSLYFLTLWILYIFKPPQTLSAPSWQAPLFSEFSLCRKEGITAGIALFITITAGIALGTFSPLFYEMFTNHKVSLGAPFFILAVVPLGIPLLIMMGVVPLLPWVPGKKSLFLLWKSLQKPLLGAMIGVFLSVFFYPQRHIYAMGFITLSLFVLASLVQSIENSGGFKRVFRSPLQQGMGVAHLGVCLCVLGMSIDSYNTQEKIALMGMGDTLTLGDFVVTLEKVERKQDDNFTKEQGVLSVSKNRKVLMHLTPEKRLYPVEKVLHTEVALGHYGLSQIYTVLGAYNGKGKWELRIAYHPWILLIWIGGGLMVFGALLALPWGSWTRGKHLKHTGQTKKENEAVQT